ncbi:MAG: hypothetical protein ACJ8FY_28980 [Gemmataceae bacterium]
MPWRLLKGGLPNVIIATLILVTLAGRAAQAQPAEPSQARFEAVSYHPPWGRCTTPVPSGAECQPSPFTQPPAQPPLSPAESSSDIVSPGLSPGLTAAIGGERVALSASMFGDAFGTVAQTATITPPPIIIPGNPNRTFGGRPIPIVIPRPPVLFDVASPAGGGLVGRTKVSDDNSPLPRDRVIFNYDYFNNVPLAAKGVDVNRFSPGFEKTFFDRLISIEVRVPFASTLSSDIIANGLGNQESTEFGDVHLTLKGLLYGSDRLNIAGGLGIGLPTARGTRIALGDGTELARIRNEEVVLTPYLAYLLTPSDRLFFQNWFAINFDANGNPLSANPDFTGLRPVGRLNDQDLFQADAQIGYWLYEPDCDSGLLRGLAPFLELHYNSTIDRANGIHAGAFSLIPRNNRFDELNLSVGAITQIGDNFNVSVGAVVPLMGQNHRSFDYQIGIHGSLLFGPTSNLWKRNN